MTTAKIRPVRLLIVRGLPGSGKSTYAQSRRGYVHYEADMYHIGSDGVYRFDLSRSGEAHSWCLDMTETALSEGRSVVVSNTFTTVREMIPYIQLSEDYHAMREVVHVAGEFGSIHEVPDDTLKRMAARWEAYPGERVLKPRRRIV